MARGGTAAKLLIERRLPLRETLLPGRAASPTGDARISGDDPLAAYDTILVETRGKVGLITLNRPQALNALNSTLVGEVNAALDVFEADPNVGCVVITGSEKAFAAGADIKEMVGHTYPQTYLDDF